MGVQVRIVSPELQLGRVMTGKPPAVNVVPVAFVSIAVLKVNTTEAVGDTPVAPFVGTTEISVGCASVRPRLPAKNAKARKPTIESR